MILLRILAYLLGAIGVFGTLVPFLPYDDFWIRGFDYPRQQMVFLLGVALLLWCGSNVDWDWYDYLVTGLLVFCLIYQSARILPYTPLWKQQSVAATRPVTDSTGLSLLVCNVLQTNESYAKVIDLARKWQPDLLLTVETNQAWEAALHAGLDTDYPYHVDVPLENFYGMILFSRLPLIDPLVKYRIKEDIPSIDATIELGNGQEIDLYFLHPMPPSPTEDYASTGRDAELALVGLEVAKKQRTAIVAGDLNDVAWSHSSRLFQRLSGLRDPRRGRGMYTTFHADYWFARWPLDHVFHSADLALAELHRLPHIGSDHFPIFVRFNHEPHAEAPDLPQKKEGDEEEARKVIKNGSSGKDDVLIDPEKD
ncbi:endonuclease/exonuclease/phosphatase family protein [Neolewinella lacunae]|uniref:Endonuclease/exonuclease/phosphatase family protein n=1 Tax=Neolewinella lacunae TaxID=1517758 RepID=A0A923PHN4_9BACT|nr:endonuclease/exonuclease/phosphatase family protein [Neolewinella lacunae]MBC6993464.1 endonuclease/exonuclease/phosphatase family protein [Neolewinella lacunae]MDN3636260.1 endonuclease/exonuclease/phosphatase family protein [Neolewinella lacunae]